MNELEELSKNNQENYLRYLKRMTLNMQSSTKAYIPAMCYDKTNILDVGCGSGVLMESIEEINPRSIITGIDLNKETINKLKLLNKEWRLYHMSFFDLYNQDYDTIIFSSVLHEISSYHENSKKKFTSIPIREAFIKANQLLSMEGNIILRDGLLIDKTNRNKPVLISFNETDDIIWLYKFQEDFRGFDGLSDVDKTITTINYNTFMVGLTFLKEFLYTYTWGKSSYPREVKERFGILDKDTWINLLNENGFEIETIVESQEEYEKYLTPKVKLKNIDNSKFIYPMMTILIKAKKVKELVKR